MQTSNCANGLTPKAIGTVISFPLKNWIFSKKKINTDIHDIKIIIASLFTSSA